MAEITIRVSDKVLKIGPIVLAAIALAWAAWYLESSGAFIPKYELRILVPAAEDVNIRTPVRLDGIRIGSVSSVELATVSADNQRRVVLGLRIEKRYQNEIRTDAIGSLQSEGLLGQRYVAIRRGFQGNPLEPGSELPFESSPRLTFDIDGFFRALSADRVTQETPIREAVLRYQMTERTDTHWQVYFISIDGKDPSDEFLKRFADIPHPVKKASLSRIVMSGSEGVLDRETGKPSIRFYVDAIRWFDGGTVEVDGGFYCGARCANSSTFLLHHENGKWTVIMARTNALA